jgi:hypothetical protein
MILASQIHRVLNSTIFAVIPFACVRRELGDNRSVGSSREARNNSSAPFPIARHILPTSQAGLSNADGGRHGVGTLRPFSRFSYAGQDTRCEKTDCLFIPVISFKIGVCADDFKSFILCFCQALRLFGSLRHASNLAKDFEHDVQRNRASRTQIETGA